MGEPSALVEEVLGVTGKRQADPVAALAAREMPRVHRSSRHLEIAQSASVEMKLLPGTGSARRTTLGLDGCVFFWVGGLAYQHSSVVLVWDAADHVDDGVAAPWDTVGLCSKSTLGRDLDIEKARETIAKCTLSFPEYQEYLGLVLTACFDSWSDYVHGRPAMQWYPGRHIGAGPPNSAAAQTFELRRVGAQPIGVGLRAVIVEEAAFAEHPRALRNFREVVAEWSADWVRVRPGHTTNTTVARYVDAMVGELVP